MRSQAAAGGPESRWKGAKRRQRSRHRDATGSSGAGGLVAAELLRVGELDSRGGFQRRIYSERKKKAKKVCLCHQRVTATESGLALRLAYSIAYVIPLSSF